MEVLRIQSQVYIPPPTPISCKSPLSFPGIVRPMDKALIHLSYEEVAAHAGHKVLIKVDLNSVPLV
jgi:hypothetical protein